MAASRGVEIVAWKPSKIELEMIADWGCAGHPVDRIACALGITELEFRAWLASLVATRAPQAAPSVPAVPPASGHRPDRVLADRVFERPGAEQFEAGIESGTPCNE